MKSCVNVYEGKLFVERKGFMKKTVFGFLILSIFLFAIYGIITNDSKLDDFPETVDELQVYLDNFTEEYLKDNNVSEHYQLSVSSINDLSNKIQEIKDQFYGTTSIDMN